VFQYIPDGTRWYFAAFAADAAAKNRPAIYSVTALFFKSVIIVVRRMGRQGLSTRTWRHSAMVVLFSAVAGVLAAALGAAAAAAAASASSASSIMSQLEDSFSVGVDWSQASLHTALAFIVLCPVFWNVMARCELRWQLLSRQIGIDKKN